MASLKAGGQSMRLAYFGHWAWCQNVGNCDEPLALMFKEYQQDWAETDDNLNSENFQRMLGRLERFFSDGETELLLADIILCTRPFLFCWLLRQLWPRSSGQAASREKEHGGPPMLHYYSGPLLFDVPVEMK